MGTLLNYIFFTKNTTPTIFNGFKTQAKEYSELNIQVIT